RCAKACVCVRGMHIVVTIITCFVSKDPPPAEIYTLSLHDALPISLAARARARGLGGLALRGFGRRSGAARAGAARFRLGRRLVLDRKSTRLNSSHRTSSYAVFCLKKKKRKCNSNAPTTALDVDLAC